MKPVAGGRSAPKAPAPKSALKLYTRAPNRGPGTNSGAPGKAASRGGAAKLRARPPKPIGNPGSRGKAPTTSGWKPGPINLNPLNRVNFDPAKALRDAFGNFAPQDALIKGVGNKIKKATGGR